MKKTKRKPKKKDLLYLEPVELSMWDDEECDCDPEDDDCDCEEFKLDRFKVLCLGDNHAWHMGAGESILKYSNVSGAQVMQFYSDSGLDKIPIDYEHNSFNPKAESAPAAGWFIPEHVAGDGLYATNITWTDKAKTMLKNKEYRYFSPVVEVDEDGSVVSLLNIALTNNPALRGIQPLVAAKVENIMAEETKEAEVVELPVETKTEVVQLSATDTEKELLKSFQDTILAALGVDSVDKAAGKLAALTELPAKYAELEAQLAASHVSKEAGEVEVMINGAVSDHRIAPAKKNEVMGLYKKIGKEGIISYLSMLPVVVPVNHQINPPNNNVEASGVSSLSANEIEIAKKFNFTAEEFAAHKVKCKALKPTKVELEEDK